MRSYLTVSGLRLVITILTILKIMAKYLSVKITHNTINILHLRRVNMKTVKTHLQPNLVITNDKQYLFHYSYNSEDVCSKSDP